MLAHPPGDGLAALPTTRVVRYSEHMPLLIASHQALQTLFYPLAGFVLKEWAALARIGQWFRSRLTGERNRGIYEILEYETSLELLDSQGRHANFYKRQTVRFLQDNIISFQDHAWGDGDLFAGYRCSPGVVADCYQQGDRWNILISLRETKSRGDVVKFNIVSSPHNSYKKDEEWQQVELRHRTHELRMNIIFPADRHCRRATLHQRGNNRTTVLGQDHFSALPDGRQTLTWETTKVRHLEVYTLRWQW